MQDRYGHDVLADARDPYRDPHRQMRRSQPVRADSGLVVEDVSTGFVGAVVRCYKAGGMHLVELEDRRGTRRAFPLGAGFWIDGNPVELLPPVRKDKKRCGPPSVTGRQLTNSGSRKVAPHRRAQVAKASRIWVEGRHDAELIEQVWGEDLRQDAIVVELLEGVDHLLAVMADFQPTAQVRAGVLLDHLVPHSKESRIAAETMARYGSDALLIVGHPFIDIWQAVKPGRLGLSSWPTIARGTDIKVGTLQALGWPAERQEHIAQGWKRILRQVRDWRDLEVELLGPVESLIDFVTVGHA